MDTSIGTILYFAAFAVLALLLIMFSIFTVTAKGVVRAALSLIFAMFTVAGLYILLNAQFLGVIQVLVYIGAVGVLILFAVMLTKKEFGSDAE